jgi:hypothetical protein
VSLLFAAFAVVVVSFWIEVAAFLSVTVTSFAALAVRFRLVLVLSGSSAILLLAEEDSVTEMICCLKEVSCRKRIDCGFGANALASRDDRRLKLCVDTKQLRQQGRIDQRHERTKSRGESGTFIWTPSKDRAT